MPDIRFDDPDALAAAVEAGFGPYGEPVEVTQDMIDAFAELTGDRQWIHVDVERARAESPFGMTIAHGFLTLGLLPRLVAGDGLRVTGHRAAVNYGAESLRFLAPVPAGSRLRARRRVTGSQPRSGGTLVTVEVEIQALGAEKPALVYRMQILYR